MKQWHFRNYHQDQTERFAAQENMDPLICALLLQRGMDCRDAVKQFIRPSMNHLHDPFLLPDMDKAVKRILQAKEQGERVTIFGDYDVDGLTATTLLLTCFQSLGINADCYIPDRMNEGYGLNREAMEQIRDLGSSLIVTVDLGVTAVDEINEMEGLDFVITDHHQPLEELPRAVAVVDPKREDCKAPFRELAGVGVAFKLACALQQQTLPLSDILREYIDLVCLGTIADIVPLYGENRFFARSGLAHLEHTKRPGLRALISQSGYQTIDATAVGFGLAPRINAAGRMGHAKLALELLVTKDEKRGAQLAAELCQLNTLRQQTEQDIYEQADHMIQATGTQGPVLVAAGEGWHQGVIGIVASKLMNRYDKPVVLLSIEEGVAHGSARSIDGFPMFDALYECEPYLLRFGGHDKAAGMTLEATQIPAFSEELNQVAMAVMEEETGGLLIDMLIEPEQISMDLAKKLAYFEPFGEGNPQPIFCMRDVSVTDCAPTRDQKHLRLTGKRKGRMFSCIGFGMGSEVVPVGSQVDIAFCITVNEFRGKPSVNLILKDIHQLN